MHVNEYDGEQPDNTLPVLLVKVTVLPSEEKFFVVSKKVKVLAEVVMSD